MLFLEKLQRMALRGLKNNIDLFALWIFYIALQPLIPGDNILARPDLIPWLMFCLSGALFLRGKRYGDGPHISLTQTKSIAGRARRRDQRGVIETLQVRRIKLNVFPCFQNNVQEASHVR